MIKKLNLITLFVLTTLISIYAQDQNIIFNLATESNMPMLTKKNDFEIAASVTNPLLDRDGFLGNLQIGYSPIKNWGINVGHFRFKESTFNNIQFTHLSLGGYLPLQIPNISKNQQSNYPEGKMPLGLLIDYYVGVEIGNVENNYSSNSGNSSSITQTSNFELEKFFLRGGLHYQGKIIGFSYIFKVGQLTYKNGSIDLGGDTSSAFYTRFQKIVRNNSEGFSEQTAKLFFGNKAIQGYLGFSFLLPRNDFVSSKKSKTYTIGIHADIDYLFQENRKKNNIWKA